MSLFATGSPPPGFVLTWPVWFSHIKVSEWEVEGIVHDSVQTLHCFPGLQLFSVRAQIPFVKCFSLFLSLETTLSCLFCQSHYTKSQASLTLTHLPAGVEHML